jgi:succinate-semialdehyde dehydrogenase
VLGGVIEGMPAFDDETFGPVAAITRVPDVDAAIRAANASQFGLSGNLWTKDIDLARRVARDLYTGGVFINGVTSSDQRVPVGGVKNSGYGRELSQFGAYAFVKPANRLNREPVACVWQTGSGTQSNPCGKWGQGQIA